MLTQSFVNSTGTLAAGVAAQICPAPSAPVSTLTVANTGSAGLVFKFGSLPADVMDGTTVTGGDVSTLTGEAISQTDAIFAVSLVGTSYSVTVGLAEVSRP
jgi:hypothetical protein